MAGFYQGRAAGMLMLDNVLGDMQARKDAERKSQQAYLLALIAQQPYQRQMEILNANPGAARGINLPGYNATPAEQEAEALAKARLATVQGWQQKAGPFERNYAGTSLITDKVPNKEFTETAANKAYMTPEDFMASLNAPTKKTLAEAQSENAQAGLYGAQAGEASAKAALTREQTTNTQQARDPNSGLTKAQIAVKQGASPNNPANLMDRNTTLANDAVALIQDLKTMSGKAGAVGAKGPSSLFGIMSKPMAGTDAAAYTAKVDRLKALLTVPNLQNMRGLGHMSDREFATMQSVAAALDRGMPEDQWDAEMSRVEEVMKNVAARASQGNTQPGAKQLDEATAKQFLDQAGQDKTKARQLAKAAGYTF